MSSRPATKRCVYPDPQSPSSYGLFLFAGSGPERGRSAGPLGIGDSAFFLPGRIPWANKNRRFRPPTNCRCSSRPQTGTARDPANPEQFIIVLPKDGAMRPNTRRHVPNWAMSALNPAGVFRKSSCISDLVANVYDGEWLVVGRSYQVSLSRYQTAAGLHLSLQWCGEFHPDHRPQLHILECALMLHLFPVRLQGRKTPPARPGAQYVKTPFSSVLITWVMK